MAVAMPGRTFRRSSADRRTVLAGAAVILIVVLLLGRNVGKEVPTWLDAHLVGWVDERYQWIVIHRETFWVFKFIFSPISHVLDSMCDFVLWLLRWLRWPGVLAAAGLIGLRTSGVGAAVTGMASFACVGLLGHWDSTMISLSLMIVSVFVALLIGIPLGIWAGRSDRANATLRTVLDAAQVMPTYVYLLPAAVLFGIRNPSAVVATVVFAIPPAVRLTSLGIRSVPVVMNEVGRSFGSNSWQMLTKVQLPMARRTILLGLNQVIMMAFGVVVIASLVGTGGVGGEVLAGLQKVNVGLAFSAGMAIVFAAIGLDRISTGERSARKWRFLPRAPATPWRDRPLVAIAVGSAAVSLVADLAASLGVRDLPQLNWLNVEKWANDAAGWANRHVRKDVPVIGGTGPVSDWLVIHVLTPARDLLQHLPWWCVIALFAAGALASGGPKVGVIVVACFVVIGSLRVWDLAMDTLSQVLVAVLLSALIALPVGVAAGRSDRLNRLLRPLLDVAQVLPPFVYLVPVIFLFNVGRVPGVIASVIYAVPPGIRLVSHGLRQVPMSARESAISFGATPLQELRKVQLPLAVRSIMLGLNQVIMMVLAMVIVAALIGAGALGLETVYGLTKSEIGRGVAGGVAIVALAIVLDRITQAWGDRAVTAPTP